ncbi:hypothetical protein BFC17_20700 [Alteromonas lipolytica]|uniref:histidine kinase n=2 Tax=Alteromonas lipolytica TaxID=1856405 RepID=A0A1E8FDF8_9ALTE|nr:hypothetical protein BFC17_20700 [Alteromonas lipolytica]
MIGATSKEQVIGLTPYDFSPEFQHDGVSSRDKGSALVAQCEKEGTVSFEWLHRKMNGFPFWCEIIMTSMVANGEEMRFVSWRDISEKKAMAQQIAEQKNTFETLFNESLDSLSLLVNYQLVDCNKAFLELFGYKSKVQVYGLTPLDISPEYQPNGLSSIEVITANAEQISDEGMKRQEWQYKKADGTLFWAEIIVTEIMLNGEMVAYVISRDISEKKALEDEIHARNEELKLSNENLSETIANLKLAQNKLIAVEKMASLGQLVAGVAHEINTPVGITLTSVTQFMEENQALRKKYQQGALTPDDFEEFLDISGEIAEIMKTNIDRTAQLVRSFKQVAVDQTIEEERQINLKHYIEEVLFSLATVLRRANVTVEFTCEDDHNVTMNPGLLAQVLTNLVINSINHGFQGAGGSTITLVVSKENDIFTLCYKDNGKGISPENLPKIFDPFFTTTRGSGGTGLGLNIIYNIITTALGGTVNCVSQPNQGVTFTITFRVSASV